MIGILALQGGFDLHAQALQKLGAETRLIKKPEQLGGLNGLIIPGGESSVLLHLLSSEFRAAITARIKDGLPLLATCAGLILIAEHVENPSQESLGLLPVNVYRNAYGRQVDSVILRDIPLSGCKNALLHEAVFIRAPKITSVSTTVKVLALRENDPILVRYQNIVAATFHPELGEDSSDVYEIAFSRF
jgi:pyridoxal 5'-phosphate synthase pdxT subunit